MNKQIKRKYVQRLSDLASMASTSHDPDTEELLALMLVSEFLCEVDMKDISDTWSEVISSARSRRRDLMLFARLHRAPMDRGVIARGVEVPE